MTSHEEADARRAEAEYARRLREIPADRYALSNPAGLFQHHQLARSILSILRETGCMPLRGKRILAVGCGAGQDLQLLESLGAHRANLAGIDLLPDRVAAAATKLCPQQTPGGRVVSPGADIRSGNATQLPWEDGAFDLVAQLMLFSSVLDSAVRQRIAVEMVRVLKPDGAILWYDTFRNNPWNPNIRRITKQELRDLFPGFSLEYRRVSLAAPLVRALVRLTWVGTALVEELSVLNTHLLGMLRRR